MPGAARTDRVPVPSRGPRVAVYAGVFDPPTLAHMEMIDTALGLFDYLYVVVGVNPNKGQTMFSPEERVDLMRESLEEWQRPYVEVVTNEGLTAEFARSVGACALVRGMRPVTDPDYEIALSLMNAKLVPSIPTVLLVARADHVYLSSTFVRDTARMGGIIVAGSVPKPVEKALRRFFPSSRGSGGAGALAGAEEEAVSPAPSKGR